MATRLRILAFNWRCLRHPQAGGSEINLFEQARRWVADGHEVTVMTADPGRESAPQRDEVVDGIRVYRRGGRFTVYLWAALFLSLHHAYFDRIVDVANGIPFFAPLFVRRPGVLIVHHVHDRQWFTELPLPVALFGWALERWIVPRLYRRWSVITVSPSTRDALVRIGFSPIQLHIVYNGLAQPSAARAAVPAGRDPHRIAYVGRLKRYKRLDRLIGAVDALRATLPDIQLDIAGAGDARPALEALVEHLELRGQVTFHGHIDETTKSRLLRRASVFAMPSMHEGWGLTVLEANAHGLPAVAFDVPGLNVSIRDGETGLLAEDEPAFRRQLASLLVDEQQRARLAAGAQRWAARFSWETSARATLRIVKRCELSPHGYAPADYRVRHAAPTPQV
jgi:glycosyltransferase involved in cell wall biosynthesis